jgi:hypothetical protein
VISGFSREADENHAIPGLLRSEQW